MANSVQVLGLIIKSTRQCNLRCSYCHDWRSRAERMPFEVLATLTAKALHLPEHRRVDFIWHGGEPLLMGQDFYEKALFLQQEFRQSQQIIRNSLQTNGTLLDDDWCEFLKTNQFQIGLSIDGPETIHNESRVYASGKGSFNEVKSAITLLQKHEIPFGALMVVNHKVLQQEPEQLFHFFLNLGVKSFAFLPARPDNLPGTGEIPTTSYVTPAEFLPFIKRIFELWYELDDPSIKIRELTSLTYALVGGSSSVCTLAGNCLGQYFHVESNGDLYHCDKYLGDKNYHVGNILADTFRDIKRSEHFQSLVTNERENLKTLNVCPWFKICNGGCPHDRYVAEKYLHGYDGKCCGSRELIEHIYQRVSDSLVSSDTLSDETSTWIGTEI